MKPINQILGATLLKQLRESPDSAATRGLILAATEKWIPETVTGYDAAVEWLQNQFPDEAAPPKAQQGITVPVTVTEDVSGTCRFVGKRTGAGEIHLTVDRLKALANGVVDWDNFTEALQEVIEEKASKNIGTELDLETATYRNHEDTDTEQTDYDFLLSNAEDAAYALLKEHCPEVLAELTGNDINDL